MTDLIQISRQIERDIDTFSVEKWGTNVPRHHLGASIIGHPCDRYLWYSYRWYAHEAFGGRMLRLFNRGHREEERFLEYLQGIGAEILDANEDQVRFSSVDGHFGGSRDGAATLPEKYGSDTVLVEFKTHSSESFKKLGTSGLKAHKPQHWAQMCVYGFHFQIKRGLYLAVNKDTDAIHADLLDLDMELGQKLTEKASSIVYGPIPPKLSEKPSYYQCKWCPAAGVCHESAQPLRNCRTCENSTPVAGGKWECSKWGIIPNEELIHGCSEHKYR